MSRFEYSSTEQGTGHPDFNIPWVKDVLSTPGLEIRDELPDRWQHGAVTNSMFDYTLAHESGIRARILFRRPCTESNAVSNWEWCYLLSLSWGVDGKTGRAHGGFSSLLLDHLTGMAAHRINDGGADPPATATMTVDYKAPINTPCVVLARAWAVDVSGRKVWLQGVIENEEKKPYATAKALFVNPKSQAPVARM